MLLPLAINADNTVLPMAIDMLLPLAIDMLLPLAIDMLLPMAIDADKLCTINIYYLLARDTMID